MNKRKFFNLMVRPFPFTSSKKIILFTFTLVALQGCVSVGPDYEKPNIDTYNNWEILKGDTSNQVQGKNIEWWIPLSDPTLDKLMVEARENNLDIKVGTLRMEEFYFRVGVITGKRYPSIDGGGSYSRDKSSKNLGSSGSIINTSNLNVSTSWEIDTFGGIRRSIESAKASYEGVIEDRNDILRLIYSKVAISYIDLRISQAQLESTKSNIESQKDLLDLTIARYESGLATSLEVAQARRVLASSMATLPPIKNNLENSKKLLIVLLGRKNGNLDDLTEVTENIPSPIDLNDINIPANLIRQRPDIRRAERELAAQTARIGIAKSDLYPKLSLTGSFGYQSTSTGDLLSPDSNFFSLGPAIKWNLFSGGRVSSLIAVEDSITKQKVHLYEKSIINALSEVEYYFSSYSESIKRLESLKVAVDASKDSVDLSLLLYKEGLVDFESVINSQSNLFVLENEYAKAKGDVSINYAKLYTSFGVIYYETLVPNSKQDKGEI